MIIMNITMRILFTFFSPPPTSFKYKWESPCGIIAKVLDCSLKVSKFELQLHYYVYFWINTLGKGMSYLIPPPATG